MKNIEIKIAIKNNSKKIISFLKKIGAKYNGEFYQYDTYYNCKNGRLKLREINKKNFELIFYRRPNKNGSKLSDYQVLNIQPEQLNTIKNIFKDAFGEKITVEKKRSLWLYKNTRIHLDKITGLGNFLELETMVKGKNLKGAKSEHVFLIGLLFLLSSRYKKEFVVKDQK